MYSSISESYVSFHRERYFQITEHLARGFQNEASKGLTGFYIYLEKDTVSQGTGNVHFFKRLKSSEETVLSVKNSFHCN